MSSFFRKSTVTPISVNAQNPSDANKSKEVSALADLKKQLVEMETRAQQAAAQRFSAQFKHANANTARLHQPEKTTHASTHAAETHHMGPRNGR